jgi:hypothetical protein
LIGNNLIGKDVDDKGKRKEAGVDEVVYPDEEGEEIGEVRKSEVEEHFRQGLFLILDIEEYFFWCDDSSCYVFVQLKF